MCLKLVQTADFKKLKKNCWNLLLIYDIILVEFSSGDLNKENAYFLLSFLSLIIDTVFFHEIK